MKTDKMTPKRKSVMKRIFASFVAVFSIALIILLYLANGASSLGNSFIIDDSGPSSTTVTSDDADDKTVAVTSALIVANHTEGQVSNAFTASPAAILF